MQFAKNVPLAPYTTFRIGGPARWFAEAASEEDVAAAVAFARERRLPLFVMSGGSNLLVSDRGYSGLVLRIALSGVSVINEGAERGKPAGESTGGQDAVNLHGRRTIFSAAAGEQWDAFVARTVAEEYGGLECLSGIPGSVGATPVQNVGAYGQEVSQTLLRVRAYDLQTLAFVSLSNSECGFGYRSSIFNTTERDRYIVTRADFALVQGGAPMLAYPDLKFYFKNEAPDLARVRRAVLDIRAQKGMVIVPGDRDSLSAGSFFKNPMVPQALVCSRFERIAGALGIPPESVPHYPAADGAAKIPAAWLVEQAGFSKGYSLGGAAISSRHTLALINPGNARAADVIALRDKIAGTVERRFGVRLESEPVWLGDL